MNILTTGVFDLIHIGHLEYLNKIKDNNNLIILIHSDRFVSTYKRKPIINEKHRLQMVKSLKLVNNAFICDNEYLLQDILDKYKIDYVYQGNTQGNIMWNYYYHIPISKNIMKFVPYNSDNLSTTKIIEKIFTKNKIKNERYSIKSILENEKLYGKNYQSPCKESILITIIPKYIKPKYILDIGVGLGGNSIYLSKKYNCNIVGIDISKNILDFTKKKNIPNTELVLCNIKNYKPNKIFNLIISRDVFMYSHTEDKYEIFRNIHSLLDKDGQFLIIDYCIGNNTKRFNTYIIKRNWKIITPEFYTKLLEDSGFNIIKCGDISKNYIEYFNNLYEKDISEYLYNSMNTKLEFLRNNELKWNYFLLQKIE